jgi:branched-chain amino acid transport system substrate-binding protein
MMSSKVEKRKKTLLFSIAFILIIYLSIQIKLYAQDNINSQFEAAVSYYQDKKLDEALELFEKLIFDNSYNSKTTASEFFKAKILFEKNNLESARQTINSFLEKFPSSNYADEMRMMLINYYVEVANYYNAFKESVVLLDYTDTNEYVRKAKETASALAYNYLNNSQLQKLYDSFASSKVKSFILFQLGKNYLRAGNNEKAKSSFLELMQIYPDSDEHSEAEDLYNLPWNYKPPVVSSDILIGVMLPLETNTAGEFTSKTAIQILEGIKYAVHEFNNVRTEKIGLVIRDTKRNVEEIETICDEYGSNSSIRAILGPVFSEEVRATLKELEDEDIPIISPTATDDDITSLSENFFQANPSFSMRGKVMAQFIYYVENKRNISILNSIDGYSPLLASSFQDEFERIGGKIIKRETYQSGSSTFSEPVSRIAGDSLLIDGIYIPLADNLDATLILSNLLNYNVRVPIYGNQDWFTAKGFETSPELSSNLTFESDYFIDFDSPDYIKFSSQFESVTGKDLNRNVLYGYDTAKFLLTIMRNIDGSRSNIKNKMISSVTSTGFHNNISFDEQRVNRFLNLLRYRNGVFELVDKFKLGN